MEKQLPFNRKERFFTGTVLPMLICTDDFRHLSRLALALGVEVQVDPVEGPESFQLFTEYSFVESRIGKFVNSSRMRL